MFQKEADGEVVGKDRTLRQPYDLRFQPTLGENSCGFILDRILSRRFEEAVHHVAPIGLGGLTGDHFLSKTNDGFEDGGTILQMDGRAKVLGFALPSLGDSQSLHSIPLSCENFGAALRLPFSWDRDAGVPIL